MSKAAILLSGIALTLALGWAQAQNPSAQAAPAPGTPGATSATPGTADMARITYCAWSASALGCCPTRPKSRI